MDAMRHPRIKICCILDRSEASMAIRCGASAVGLVSGMPSGPGVIDDDAIADIAAFVPPPIATFLLTSRQSAEGIVEQHRRVRTSTIQIVDAVPMEAYDALRKELPGVKLVQVIHVTGRSSIDEALTVDGKVDAILLDSGNPQLPVKELGGTGRAHDWSISRIIRERVSVPVFLAGGLRPENVREAIDVVGPFGVDVCSGVRTNGRLDERRLGAFVRACVPPFNAGK